jgi:2-succinyl-6-hydroxy-2,4-cyclohexadiene-1-carboxylate synthase
VKSKHLLSYTDSAEQGLPAIVFLHGFMGNRADWSEVTQILLGQYRCLTIDLPGHGDTIIADESQYTMENTAELVASIAECVGIKRFHLVGYSMGGRLALYLALHFPQMIHSLILESASPGIEGSEERENRRRADAELACRILSIPAESFIDEWYNQPLFESMKRRHERLKQLKMNRRCLFAGGLAGSLRQMGTGSQPPLWNKLDTLTTPTLLLVGERDNTFRTVAEQMKIRNKRLAVQILSGCGHNCHWEETRVFAERVNEFCLTLKVSS